MNKRAFYLNKTTGSKPRFAYGKRTLRNRLIEHNIKRWGVPDVMADGDYVVTLEWRHSIFPGLLFREF